MGRATIERLRLTGELVRDEPGIVELITTTGTTTDEDVRKAISRLVAKRINVVVPQSDATLRRIHEFMIEA